MMTWFCVLVLTVVQSSGDESFADTSDLRAHPDVYVLETFTSATEIQSWKQSTEKKYVLQSIGFRPSTQLLTQDPEWKTDKSMYFELPDQHYALAHGLRRPFPFVSSMKDQSEYVV